MKARKWLRGLLSGFLCASVISAFGGSTAVTIHAEEDDDSDGIVANKTARVDMEDGSYIIDLDAYVTGEVVTTTTPVDVVLVVDVSNSMAWSVENAGNAQESQRMPTGTQTSKIKDAMDAAKIFSELLLRDNPSKEADEQNSLTFVTFAGFDKEWSSRQISNSYMDSTQTIFESETVENTANSYFNSVDIRYNNGTYYLQLPTSPTQSSTGSNLGGTNYDYAFYEANKAITTLQGRYSNYKDTGRKTFVVFMTDGAPSLYNGYVYQRSNDQDVRYGIHIPGTPDEYSYNADYHSANAWLNYISSNTHTYAKGVYERVSGNLFAVGFDLDHGGFSGVSWDQEELKPFLENMPGSTISVELAADSDSLAEIFKGLAKKAAEAAMELTSEAVMKDIVANSFTLPEGASPDDISVYVVPYDTTTHDWSTTTKYTKDQWKTLTNPAEEIEVSIDGDTVDITGFDYSTHCKVDAEQSEDAELNAKAAKIVVSFRIYAKPESITGSSVVTNGAESGIYDQNGNVVTTFDIPNVTYENATYIIDYAKPTVLNYNNILSTVTRIDEPGDDILKGIRIQPENGESSFDFEKDYVTDYAVVTYKHVEDGTDVGLFKVTYTPRTTNWNGYDKLFIMGEPKDSSHAPDDEISGGNVWGLMTVLPANNVYYEDTFVNTSKDGGETGTVGITYTNDWSEVGNSTNQAENANGTVMGWEETLADDTRYSDGSAHKASGTGTATFSFTGTGVDIYSRTNNKTGTIVVSVSGTPEGSDTKVVKNYIISNKAASGDYYQIPTFTIDNLDYGTYNVKITVTKAAASKGRLEYYLDGIRVYNPIQNKENEELVQEAYVNELGAVFTEVKDLLEGNKIAFIDENAEGEQAEEEDYTGNEFAPEHEVYVKAGSSVVIGADDTSKNYYIGLKAPEGSTSVEMTEGSGKTTKTIAHTTDLYYKVTPASDGTITIKNTGSTLLALTKIRATDSDNRGVSPDAVTYSNVDAERAASALALFAEMDYADYEDDVLTPEEAEITEQPEVEEAVEAPEEEPEEEIIELGEDDITISITEPEPAEEETSAAEDDSVSLLKQWYQNLFSAIARLFR